MTEHAVVEKKIPKLHYLFVNDPPRWLAEFLAERARLLMGETLPSPFKLFVLLALKQEEPSTYPPLLSLTNLSSRIQLHFNCEYIDWPQFDDFYVVTRTQTPDDMIEVLQNYYKTSLHVYRNANFKVYGWIGTMKECIQHSSVLCSFPSYLARFEVYETITDYCEWEIEFYDGSFGISSLLSLASLGKTKKPSDEQLEQLMNFNDDEKPVHLEYSEKSDVGVGTF